MFKRVIVNGPTGAIGTALIKALLLEDIEVLAVYHESSKRAKAVLDNLGVEAVPCDLQRIRELPQIIRDKGLETHYDCFYHLAWDGTFGDARNNMQGQESNIRYTLDAVETAYDLGCNTFVGAGSQAEYGRVEGFLRGDIPVNPENGYGIAKLCAGQMSRILCEQKKMKHIWTRILSIYGPGDGPNTMIMSTIRKLLDGEKPALTKGEQMWDYLYSEDAGRALALLGEKGVHGKVYPIGSGQARPLKEYIEILKNSINPELELGYGEIPYGPKQVMHLCADIRELQKDTGFVPAIPFDEGIWRTILWVENQNR